MVIQTRGPLLELASLDESRYNFSLDFMKLFLEHSGLTATEYARKYLQQYCRGGVYNNIDAYFDAGYLRASYSRQLYPTKKLRDRVAKEYGGWMFWQRYTVVDDDGFFEVEDDIFEEVF